MSRTLSPVAVTMMSAAISWPEVKAQASLGEGFDLAIDDRRLACAHGGEQVPVGDEAHAAGPKVRIGG